MKNDKNFWIAGLIFSAIIFLTVLLNQEQIKEFIEEGIKFGGYLAVSFFSFLTDVLVQPFGPELPGSIAIFFGLNYFAIILFCALGSSIGGLTSFYLGKKGLSKKLKHSYQKKKYQKHYKFFEKYGKWSLLMAAIAPLPYTLFCIISGAFKMRVQQFIFYGVLPRIIRIALILTLLQFFLKIN